MALMPLACVNTSSSTSGDDTINDEPELLEIDDLHVEYSSASNSYAWQRDNKTDTMIRVNERVSWFVEFKFHNRKKTETLKFVGWDSGNNAPTAQDDLGHQYKALVFDPSAEIYSGSGWGINRKWSLLPDREQTILVPFDCPDKDAKNMTIELPAGAFGLKGRFRVKFKIDNESRMLKKTHWPSTR
jgi:hypothetical protein